MITEEKFLNELADRWTDREYKFDSRLKRTIIKIKEDLGEEVNYEILDYTHDNIFVGTIWQGTAQKDSLKNYINEMSSVRIK